MKLGVHWLVVFWGLALAAGVGWAEPQFPPVPENPAGTQPGTNDKFLPEKVSSLYEKAGFPAYFDARTLLWTETAKRRSDLGPRLPVVFDDQIRQFRLSLARWLDGEPTNTAALILAGNYHYFYRQRDAARWYYAQASRLDPQSGDARLAFADYYLYEWDPENALQVTSGFNQPRILLRKAAAYWLKGEYPLSLGYLLQAQPLPPGERQAREILMAKAYLALGDYQAASLRLKDGYLGEPITGVLVRELRGWTGWLTGVPGFAEKTWSEGRMASPDYRFWDGYLSWLQYSKAGLDTVPFNWRDGDLQSMAKLFNGYTWLKSGDVNQAYQAFLEAIKNDHRSLLGFLEAGNALVRRGYPNDAIDLYNQGLAVNPNFSPLLAGRAAAYRRLKQNAKADNDLAAYEASLKKAGTGKLSGRLVTEDHRVLLVVTGQTRNLFGMWLSEDGAHWQWRFWWGGPLPLPENVKKVWVLPTGPDLSGEVMLMKAAEPQNGPATVQILLSPDMTSLKLSLPSRVVLENGAGESMVADQPVSELPVPAGFFKPGEGEIRCWYRSESGYWGKQRLTLTSQSSAASQPIRFQAKGADWTRDRRIQLAIKPEGGGEVVPGLQMTVFEEGKESGRWEPFQTQPSVELSGGDGLKRIVIKLRDPAGNAGEASVDVALDTVPPRLVELETFSDQAGELGYRLKTDEPVMARWGTVSLSGLWQTVSLGEGFTQEFRGVVHPGEQVFYRLFLKDRAGNTTTVDPIPINRSLTGQAERFMVKPVDSTAASRWVTIAPENSGNDVKWSVSNDLRVWSPWQTGNTALKWRLDSVEGSPLVFVRAQIGDDVKIVQVIPVDPRGSLEPETNGSVK